ncbi:MFS transporter [Myxococcota bacterium]|nr:MFS transporter [Myxococcota bacterium]
MSSSFDHSAAFRVRRFFNWFPLGLSYALLYMGRYNLTVSKNELGGLMTKEAFGLIFFFGALAYGVAFLVNGPLTDKMGGKRAILLALAGSGVMNLLMGMYIQSVLTAKAPPSTDSITHTMSLLYAVNMYFQSFGAVAIVKVNSHWFHVRERGGFSGIFGTMISSGIFLAFTVNGWLLEFLGAGKGAIKPTWWVFWGPAILMAAIFVVEWLVLKDQPSHAGYEDFDTGDASSGEESDVTLRDIVLRVLTNPIILTVGLIEFCTGVLRNGVMHWFPIYAKEVWVLPSTHFVRRGDWGNWVHTVLPFFVGAAVSFAVSYALRRKKKSFGWATLTGGVLFLVPFLQGGWGGILMVAGVVGGNLAGWMSDLIFESRRAPVAGLLYASLVVASLFMLATMGGDTNVVGRVDAKDKAAYPLRVGDRIVGVNEQKDIKQWSQVGRAIRCVPSRCQQGAAWDAKKCTCRAHRKAVATAVSMPIESVGRLAISIVREGKSMTIHLDQSHKVMRAGDARILPIAPHLAVNPFWLCLIVFLMSMSVIGTHGLLSGTATMDFGGRKGAATAVGLIDGFVYLGTAVQSVALGFLTTRDWMYWPIFLLPFGVIGFVLLLRIWHAIPSGKKAKAAH